MEDLAARLHELKLGTARRCMENMRQNTADWADAPMLLDATVYTDPARLERERAILFRRTPLLACLSSDLPGPGSFRTYDDTGIPILLVRDKAGTLRGFLNRCPHRGARVVRETSGNAARFSCWFHAWTFDQAGDLLAVPDREGFEPCLPGRGLTPVAVTERHGFVFVTAEGKAPIDLDGFLGELGPHLELLNVGSAELVKTAVVPAAANWKYCLDTFGESYHFRSLHRASFGGTLKQYPYQVYDRLGPHHRTTWSKDYMLDWSDKRESDWDVDRMITWIIYLFPNTIIYTGAIENGLSFLTTYRHYPGASPGETLMYKTIYAPSGVQSDAHRQQAEQAFDAVVKVLVEEDFRVASEAYAAMANTASGTHLILGRQEIALQNQQRALAAAIGMPCTPDRPSTERLPDAVAARVTGLHA
jgi:nitrite reductase/ring-hydroxylating ferredoxin subunit